MARTIQECSEAFIHKLNAPTRRRRIDIRQQNVWLKGALTASYGAGNLKGTRLKPNDELKNRIKQLLGDWRFQLKTGSTSDFQAFDTSITNTIGKVHSSREETDPGCWLTFGRIQKICNIWLKYHFVLYFSGSDGTFTGDNTWLESLVNYVHVPIDRKVLESLSPKHSEHTKLGNNILSWKRDLQEPRYLTLQKILRYEAKEKGYNSALHYEMDIIWT